jgi:CubicO group peptidase (beta-lactamase class C family)
MRRAAVVVFAISCAATDPRAARVQNGLRSAATPAISHDVDASLALHHVPGVSVAVMDGGRIVWARGWGRLRADGAAPVTAATLFGAASISKPVAALAALRLVERGVLDLDGDVNARLRSWHIPTSALAAGPITLRHLLSHTAGIPDTAPPRGYRPDHGPGTLRAALEENPKWTSLAFAPGTQWAYSGRGYTVLQVLLEDVTGVSFPALLRDSVFTPARMANSTFDLPLSPALAARAAVGHDAGGRPFEDPRRSVVELARGGLWTTPSDLLELVLELTQRHAVASAATERLMWTAIKHAWGLGFQTEGSGRNQVVGHTGHNWGFKSKLVFYPALGSGSVIMTNGEGGDAVQNELQRAIAAEYGWPNWPPLRARTAMVRQPPAALEALRGTYEALDGPSEGLRGTCQR